MTEALADAPADIGTIRTEITVGTTDLRNALRSVVVHAGPDKEMPALQRVRLSIQRGNIILSATNRYTVGVGLVSIWDNTYDDNGVIVDLTLTTVGEILAMFKAGGGQDEDRGDDDLRIRITDRHLIITDMAGLFAGKEVIWPRTATEDSFPDLIAVTGQMLAQAGTGHATTLYTNGKLLGLFKTAAAIYRQPVVIEPTRDDGGALVISVGESFIGALMPIKPTDEHVTEQEAWRLSWHRRLGVLNPDTGALVDA